MLKKAICSIISSKRNSREVFLVDSNNNSRVGFMIIQGLTYSIRKISRPSRNQTFSVGNSSNRAATCSRANNRKEVATCSAINSSNLTFSVGNSNKPQTPCSPHNNRGHSRASNPNCPSPQLPTLTLFGNISISYASAWTPNIFRTFAWIQPTFTETSAWVTCLMISNVPLSYS